MVENSIVCDIHLLSYFRSGNPRFIIKKSDYFGTREKTSPNIPNHA